MWSGTWTAYPERVNIAEVLTHIQPCVKLPNPDQDTPGEGFMGEERGKRDPGDQPGMRVLDIETRRVL